MSWSGWLLELLSEPEELELSWSESLLVISPPPRTGATAGASSLHASIESESATENTAETAAVNKADFFMINPL